MCLLAWIALHDFNYISRFSKSAANVILITFCTTYIIAKQKYEFRTYFLKLNLPSAVKG